MDGTVVSPGRVLGVDAELPGAEVGLDVVLEDPAGVVGLPGRNVELVGTIVVITAVVEVAVVAVVEVAGAVVVTPVVVVGDAVVDVDGEWMVVVVRGGVGRGAVLVVTG